MTTKPPVGRLLLMACAMVLGCFMQFNFGTLRGRTALKDEFELIRSLKEYNHSRTYVVKSQIDDRILCAGPREEVQQSMEPLYFKASYGLHVGKTVQYGRFNNQVITLFNALDSAIDSGGMTVVVVSGWAEDFVNTFFQDEISWDQFTRDFPIVREAQLRQHPLNLITHSSRVLFFRSHDSVAEKNEWHVTQSRRISFLHYLFSSLGGVTCHLMEKILDYTEKTFGERRFIAVHVRNMEHKCQRRNKEHVEQCIMDPSYVKSILKPSGLYGKLPIVLLSDMQEQDKLRRLQNELEKVVVPMWDIGTAQSLFLDMVLGGASEIFVGNQASSMSRNIGIIREAFGKRAFTNYIYTQKTRDGKWESLTPHHPYSWLLEDI